jgi:hypothetical protein
MYIHTNYIHHMNIWINGVCTKYNIYYNILIYTIIAMYSFSSFARVQRGVEKGENFFYKKREVFLQSSTYSTGPIASA